MSLIDWLNPKKTAWWNRDEWYKTGETVCVEVVEEHGCPSWDVKSVKVYHYKHKESCEERNQLHRMGPFTIEKTVFEDPCEKQVQIMGNGVPPLESFDLYKGGKYE